MNTALRNPFMLQEGTLLLFLLLFHLEGDRRGERERGGGGEREREIVGDPSSPRDPSL